MLYATRMCIVHLMLSFTCTKLVLLGHKQLQNKFLLLLYNKQNVSTRAKWVSVNGAMIYYFSLLTKMRLNYE